MLGVFTATLDAPHTPPTWPNRLGRPSSRTQAPLSSVSPALNALGQDLWRYNLDQLIEAAEVGGIECEQSTDAVYQHGRDKVGVMHLLARS